MIILKKSSTRVVIFAAQNRLNKILPRVSPVHTSVLHQHTQHVLHNSTGKRTGNGLVVPMAFPMVGRKGPAQLPDFVWEPYILL